MAEYVGLPYAKGSVTSKAAAKSMVEPAKNQREWVRQFIWNQGAMGATADEVEVVLGINGSAVRPRIIELCEEQKIEKTELVRSTRKGREATVYVALDPVHWKPRSRKKKLTEAQKWEARARRVAGLYKDALTRIAELEAELEGWEEGHDGRR